MILFVSDFALIIPGSTAARARAEYNVLLELCNRIIDIGPPGKDRKQYLLTSMTKTVL